MKNAWIILKKQIKDTVKNKTVLIQFVMFPMMTLIMENAIKMEHMPEHFFAKLFSVMYIGMAPLTSVASIIAEEKEQNTLRVLLMSNVKSWEYLLGVCSYVWVICMIGAGVIAAAAGFPSKDCLLYFGVMGIGILVSSLIGASIGITAKNQMSSTSVAMPAMMVLSFLPMLAMFNESIEKVAKILYTQQIYHFIQQLSCDTIELEAASILIIAANSLIAAAYFLFAYHKNGLE